MASKRKYRSDKLFDILDDFFSECLNISELGIINTIIDYSETHASRKFEKFVEKNLKNAELHKNKIFKELLEKIFNEEDSSKNNAYNFVFLKNGYVPEVAVIYNVDYDDDEVEYIQKRMRDEYCLSIRYEIDRRRIIVECV